MDINDQIAANSGLVYMQLHRFNLVDDPDAESYAYEALYKAIITYSEDKSASFATYATCVIANALRMHIRHLHRKKQLQTISYYTPFSISDDDEGYLIDTIQSMCAAEDEFISEESCSKILYIFSKHLNALSKKKRAIIDMHYTQPEKTQKDIAKLFNTSQSAVSSTIAIFKNKLRKELEETL